MMNENGRHTKQDRTHSVSNLNLTVFTSADELATSAAEYVIDILNKAVSEKGKATLVLSGGETPKKLYTLLAQDKFSKRLAWENIYIFWGDERCVHLMDERNNAFQAKKIVLSKVPVPAQNIFPIPVNLQPDVAAQSYESEIIHFFGKDPIRFDLILLGLGKNGHTASLFPNTPVLNELHAGIRKVFVEKDQIYRLTMTAPLINQAHHILTLVEGKSKSTIIKEVIADSKVTHYPFQLIHPKQGVMELYIDTDAASLL